MMKAKRKPTVVDGISSLIFYWCSLIDERYLLAIAGGVVLFVLVVYWLF